MMETTREGIGKGGGIVRQERDKSRKIVVSRCQGQREEGEVPGSKDPH